ncbi:LOW QUALITY PROTEIN: hypothetical protein CH63R_11001 [Colletotrichum higginsianum IMI 349063]|uniref:Uncharacterized protein n=1 Tax=Colletotrichum higginsianum (strain IMI 349063) TaxID=759273 RepID=A0A1B7Y4C1_COLHI|nr:LOW QUALITY PROTEIN: uncharacterized protein CH63R_11001 [Colletotrichum higginsianum IMI 349063]OBR06881.1 LOW QUALITY PROTEIN: hypothetical protein CH63R_11001 [Colletotrichum higginsianum IMI 349063]GJD04763.1 hypothetical protein ColKHC_13588 [Colletotrichum higginsianum]
MAGFIVLLSAAVTLAVPDFIIARDSNSQGFDTAGITTGTGGGIGPEGSNKSQVDFVVDTQAISHASCGHLGLSQFKNSQN